ncbi:hypothetical protein [Lysinibacillus sp. NPDC056232]|uniref:hypothetical protein n=1 Tax=Lysinibacillus sp. NPDC056232 TaxID=3345756 RepID=UPI0035D81834
MSAFVIKILEGIQEIAAFVLLFCGYIYFRQLKNKRLERKLSWFEIVMYVITGIAIFFFAGSFLLLFLDKFLY